MRSRPLFAFSTLVSALISLTAQAESLGFSVSRPALESNEVGITVSVQDDETLQPIEGAKITVSDSLSSVPDSISFDGETWIDGSESFPVPLDHAKVISVQKEGYTPVTLAGVHHHEVMIELKRLEDAKAGEVLASGLMGDYQVSPDDQQVRAGFVFRNINVLDLVHFQLDSFLSPLKDTINVWGSRKIPSNIVLPKQDIRILFGSVHLDKQSYRIPLRPGYETQLISAQGDIAVSDIVNLVIGGGKPGVSTLNQVNFSRIGITSPFTPTADLEMAVPANFDLAPSHQVTVQEPPFKSEVLVAAVTDLRGDRQILIPTDIKSPASRDWDWSESLPSVTVKSTTQSMGRERAVVAVAMADKGKRFSGVVVSNPGSQVSVGQFLNAETPRQWVTRGAIRLVSTPNSVGTAVFESSYQPAGDGRKPVKYPIWYVYALPSAGDLSIPTTLVPPGAPLADVAVSHLEFGNSLNEGELDGRGVLTQLTRFTRSVADKLAH